MPDSPPAAATAPPAHASVPGLLLTLCAVMLLLYLGDRFLAQLEQRELLQAARREFQAGIALRAEGKPAEAIDHLRQAHTLVRSDRDYALALADAQTAARQAEGARRILDDLLAAEPNDARANLLMARWMVSEGQFGSANSYYHRAIYGTWPADSAQSRLDARLELAHMLADHGTREELLSETLALEESAPESVAVMKKIAPLLLRSGSGARAAAAYRFLLGQDRNADSYLGLGRAELEMGDYRGAQSAFSAALELRPNDPFLEGQMSRAGRLADLDPTPRYLTSREKFARSSQVLELTKADIASCLVGKNPSTAVRSEVTEADQLLSKRDGSEVTNEMAEERLDAAESLWTARPTVCHTPPSDYDPVPLIMSKLHSTK
jgi:tetratricopeptide (TPR) repeat protein